MSEERPPDYPPTSELGCHPNDPHGTSNVSNTDENEAKWRQLLEQQNRSFLAIIQAIPSSVPSSSGNMLRFPDFDPEKRDVDARAWLTTADMCVTDQHHKGALLMIALSRALKGEASNWLSSISYPGMKWSEFRELFLSRYDCRETTAAFLINLNTKKPKENECLAAYAATLMTSLMSRWNGLTTEQIAIATVLAHVAKIDSRVQRLSFTTDIKTRNELQRELKAVSFLKRSATPNDEREGPDTKKPRPNGPHTAIKCCNCGQLGHKSMNCRVTRNTKPNTGNSSSNNNAGSQPKGRSERITCFRCQRQGHYASNCPEQSNHEAGSKSSTGSVKEKRMDVCTVQSPASF